MIPGLSDHMHLAHVHVVRAQQLGSEPLSGDSIIGRSTCPGSVASHSGLARVGA